MIGEIIVSLAGVAGFIAGFSKFYGSDSDDSGEAESVDHQDKIKEKVEESHGIREDRYTNLRFVLIFPVGWIVLSLLVSLFSGPTIVLPSIVNSTLIWNWVVFLFVIFILGAIAWKLGEKIYLKIA